MKLVKPAVGFTRFLGIIGLVALVAWLWVVWVTTVVPAAYHQPWERLSMVVLYLWLVASAVYKVLLIAGWKVPILGYSAIVLFVLLIAHIMQVTEVTRGVWSPWSFPVGIVLLLIAVITDFPRIGDDSGPRGDRFGATA